MTRQCEMCPESNPKPATIYCPADSCYLCAACDHEVHSANRLASRHVRRQLVVDDITDGSSINDDSDARVPDVSSSTTTETATREAVNVPTKTSNNKEQAMDVDVNTQFPSLNDVSVTFEDAAEYDFCFDSIAPRMAPLAGADDENNLFSDGKLAKSFYPDLSWDSVVSDAFEHVVPDVEVCTPNDMVDTTRFSTNRTRESTRRTARCIKAEKIEVKVEDQLSVKLENRIDTEVQGQSSSPKRGLGPKSSAEISSSALTLKKDGKTVGLGGKRDKKELYASQTSVKRSNEMNVEKIGGIGEGVEDKVKMYEQRKKRRMEALARFRSKRANRSFTKKVRYECRKQLADSRPRVKGRFVRKVEMALFRKYGAMYRDHLDELKEQSQDRRIPLL